MEDLTELRNAVMKFDGCELKKSAINTVFGDGNPTSDIMLIGEAPGADEDKYGIPFCGRSGKLLDKILLSVGLDRTKVYITNTVFWRPPNNRRPTPQELKLCKPFVEMHISIVNPKLIILVGGTAIESLLGPGKSVGSLRGQYFNYENQYIKKPIPTTVIFHPAYLLRNPAKKKDMWHDMLKIKRDFLV